MAFCQQSGWNTVALKIPFHGVSSISGG